MLVLSRKTGERICIGEDIEVTIISVQGDRVRLGFNAPRSVCIHRAEVQRRIDQERLLDCQPAAAPASREGATLCP